jgi:hypothetical protein
MIPFKTFLATLETKDNQSILEAIRLGYGAIYESLEDNVTTLYRGMENEYNPHHDLSKTDAPHGYSTWTDNPNLARKYAGQNGFIYKITLPTSEMGNEYMDTDGERTLFFNNEKKAGLDNISGNEYLIYHHHDLFNDDSISILESIDGYRAIYESFYDTVELPVPGSRSNQRIQIDIFRNPSLKEMSREIGKDANDASNVRLSVDDSASPDVYAWQGDVLHPYMKEHSSVPVDFGFWFYNGNLGSDWIAEDWNSLKNPKAVARAIKKVFPRHDELPMMDENIVDLLTGELLDEKQPDPTEYAEYETY